MEKVSSEILTRFLGEFGVLGIYFLFFLFSLILFYCFYRAGSSYFFTDRIWKITSGRDKFSSNEIDDIWNEIRDVESFRFKTRLNVNSHDQIKQIKNYIDEKKIVWRDLIPAGKHFDVQTLKIYNKKYLLWLILTLSAALLSYSFMAIPSYFFPKYNHTAYLYTKESNLNFEYYGNKIITKNQKIDDNDCKDQENLENKFSELGINNKDIEIFCNAIKSNDQIYLKDTIKQQKTMVTFWMGIFLLLSIILFRKSFSFLMALNLKNKIDKIEMEKENQKIINHRDQKLTEIYKTIDLKE